MQLELDCVAAFHRKMDVSRQQPMPTHYTEGIVQSGKEAVRLSQVLEPFVGNDIRALRAHLILEEAGEFVTALGEGDEVSALDGLIDLLYVLLGTAATFDWPMDEAFSEVHVSNMTKEKQPDDPSAERVRVKGPNYRAPDLAGVLERYRGGDRPDRSNLYEALERRLKR